jgi:DNA-binding HxlR family transcriptional regulator
MTKLPTPEFRSPCPIASTLDLVGDRWSLVLLRDLANGKRRFSHFLTSPERITTSVLADRLEKLEQAGLIERRLYQPRPKRYEFHLTPTGAGLLPVLQAMARWAQAHVPDRWTAPAAFMEKKPQDIV